MRTSRRLEVSDDDRAQLGRLLRAPTTAQRVALRARGRPRSPQGRGALRTASDDHEGESGGGDREDPGGEASGRNAVEYEDPCASGRTEPGAGRAGLAGGPRGGAPGGALPGLYGPAG